MKPRIVIVGGGFGGVYTARKLAQYADRDRIDLTIISRANYFLFTPLLHEVATGGLNPLSVAEPLREIFRKDKVRVIQAEVTAIDLARKVVKTTGTCEIPYDYLVYSGGATTNFYGIPGAEQHSVTLKNLEDALAVRSRVIDSFEAALAMRAHQARHVSEPDYAKELLSFVVVGGGPTGVELTTELAEFIHGTMCTYYKKAGIDWSQVSITLLNAAPELLGQCHPKMRTTALNALKRMGVKVVLGAQVTEVTERSVKLKDGTAIPTAHVFWVAGVRALTPAFEGKKVALDKGGRAVLDPYLHLTSPHAEVYPDVFVLGDAGGTSPMLAQAATRAAEVVARNIIRSIDNARHPGRLKQLTPFVFHSKGSLVSLGQWDAAGDIFGIRISGPIAWFIWRSTYLFKFSTWRKRYKVATEWTVNLFSPRDMTKVR